MPVTGKRFTSLDRETNVSTANFAIGDNGIINDPMNLFKAPDTSLESMIKSAVQTSIPTADTTTALESVTRGVKGAKATFQDIAQLSVNDLDNYLGDITGDNPAIQKQIKNLIKKCSTKGAGYGLPNKPYDASLSCDSTGMSMSGSQGKGNSCDVSSMNDLLNKLSGGEYTSDYKDLNAALKKIMSLAGMGYNMGLCGVFGALTKDVDLEVAGKAAGALLGSLGLAGNTNAVLDISKSATAVSALLYNPGAVTTFLDNYTAPHGTKGSTQTVLAERTLGGLELLDTNWNKSQEDGVLSCSAASVHRDDLGTAWTAQLTNKSFGSSQLDNLADNDDDFVLASYLMRA